MAKRQNRNKYVGNTPGLELPKRRKRKGSRTTYRVPKEAQALAKDKAYVAFQDTPRLNRVTSDLHIRSICDTIIGGKKVNIVRTTTKQNPNYDYKLLIIVGGTRCDQDAVVTHRVDGKNHKRCCEHSLEDYWIDNGEIKERS